MITFYPGPSKIYPRVADYVKEGLESGILSMNHRSPDFMELMADTISLLEEKLNIPQDYQVVFCSSATECWEIIAQSVITSQSSHFYNGAFGEKWKNYTNKLQSAVEEISFDLESLPDNSASAESDLVCYTHNETSNGTCLPDEFMQTLREHHPDQLIAVDATSSMAGVKLDFSKADLWYASVQKCFGLPAGMAVMVCSPQAIERVRQVGENDHYNSLSFILENAEKHQTPYTPNILGIYLLSKTLQDRGAIEEVDQQTKRRYHDLVGTIDELDAFQFLIHNREVHSPTVLAITSQDKAVSALKEQAMEAGIVLGSGYGPWKETTFRIANFPAIEDHEVALLKDFLSTV